MTYLVLGSNSFSGGAFIAYLLEKHPDAKVLAVSRSKEYHPTLLAYKHSPHQKSVHFFQLDINHDLDAITKLIADEKPHYIVNFSAQGMVSQSWENPEQWFQTNALSLVKLVDKIHTFSFIKKFVQVSTPEVYGPCNDMKESFCYAPSSPYAASKASADLALYAYFKTHDFPINFTRASNVYGTYQQLYRIIPKTILSIKKGEKLTLHGGGEAVRSFIHIKDVASATLEIAHNAPSGECYHISDTKTISIYNLVQRICSQLNVNFADVVTVGKPRVGEDSLYLLNADKLRHEFQWQPKVSLNEGIEEIIQWIESHIKVLETFPDYYIHKA